ncbi:MAG: hypothetical protein HY051_01775 [Candidatus Aenigmarchaeota archaeon]|nr:hypothetical protein [Candidatus Aenigmarchaeota archaeon]
MVDFLLNRMNGEFLFTYPPDQNGIQDSFGFSGNYPGILINPTGPLGFISLLYIKTMLQLPKWGYGVYKHIDSFEINPTYREYYAATLATKQDLEGKIKAGLESASRAISDYELLAHDHRKYEDYLTYLNNYGQGMKDLEKARKEKNEDGAKKAERMILEANTSLKAVFIDQVDVHTGEGVALKLIVSRWPNIIVDFMKLEDDMTTSEDIVKRLVPKITTAEAVVLATKNKLFTRWKELFRGAVTQRYLNILSLMNARRKSIEQYKKWLRPYIIQHELLQESQEKGGSALGPASGSSAGQGGKSLTHRLKAGAHAMSFHDIAAYAWKPFAPGDMYRASVERKEIDVKLEFLGKDTSDRGRAEDTAILQRFGLSYDNVKGGKFTTNFWLNPYDIVAKVGLYGEKAGSKSGRIADGGKCLVDEYPWIKPKEIEAQAIRLIKDSEGQQRNYYNTLLLHPDYMYYILWDLIFSRAIISIPQGTVDDGFVFIKIAFISQNVLLVKLIERWASEQRFDRNVEEVLGLTAIDEKEDIDASITGNMEVEAKKKFSALYEKADGKDKGKEEKGFDFIKSIEHRLNELSNGLQIFGMNFQLFKKGPYETNLRDRITRQFSKAFADTYRDEFISWFEDAAKIGD